MEASLEIVLNFIKPFIEQYPALTSIAVVLYFAGLVLKPLIFFLKEVIDITPAVNDNEKLAKIIDSKAYKIAAFILDWFARLKLPQKKK